MVQVSISPRPFVGLFLPLGREVSCWRRQEAAVPLFLSRVVSLATLAAQGTHDFPWDLLSQLSLTASVTKFEPLFITFFHFLESCRMFSLPCRPALIVLWAMSQLLEWHIMVNKF